MDLDQYLALRSEIVARGYGGDIDWAEAVTGPDNAEAFAIEHAFVVCNSGMKAQIARSIFERVKRALQEGKHPYSDERRPDGRLLKIFGHAGKAQAIWSVWNNRIDWYTRYLAAAGSAQPRTTCVRRSRRSPGTGLAPWTMLSGERATSG